VTIVPAILTNELAMASRALGAFQALSPTVHVDVLDNTLVPGQTLLPSDFPPFAHGSFVWHLMVKDPLQYLNACSEFQTKAVIVHAELGGNLLAIADAIHAKGFLAGIAINPATPVAMLEPWLAGFDWVQLMTVDPGKQGGEFQAAVLPKLVEVQRLAPKTPLIVDGGINNQTIHQVLRYRPAMITVGSFLTPGVTLAEHWRELEQALKQGGA